MKWILEISFSHNNYSNIVIFHFSLYLRYIKGMREGRRERIGLLTKNQRELTIHAHEKLRDLQKRRDDIKLRSAERHSSILSNEPSELQKIQSELNKLSHAVSRLEYDVDLGISVIVQDLDVILSSEILKSWIL